MRFTRDPAELFMAYLLAGLFCTLVWQSATYQEDLASIVRVATVFVSPVWVWLMYEFLFGMAARRSGKRPGVNPIESTT